MTLDEYLSEKFNLEIVTVLRGASCYNLQDDIVRGETILGRGYCCPKVLIMQPVTSLYWTDETYVSSEELAPLLDRDTSTFDGNEQVVVDKLIGSIENTIRILVEYGRL